MSEMRQITCADYNAWVKMWHSGDRKMYLGAFLMEQAPYPIDDPDLYNEHDKSAAATMFFSRYVTASDRVMHPRRFHDKSRNYDKNSESLNINQADFLN